MIEMEKVNGGTLAGLIQSVYGEYGGFLGEETASQLMKDILSGLSLMHEKNFVHRDLKPENILINIEESGLKGK